MTAHHTAATDPRPPAGLAPSDLSAPPAAGVPGLPALRLDHLVVTTRFDLAAAAALYERLGFRLSPQGRHGLGSINHVLLFEDDSYLEVIGVPTDGGLQRPEVRDAPVGIDALVYHAADAQALHDSLRAQGLPVQPVQPLSRPVKRPEGPREARFQAVRTPPGTIEAGRLYYCQHLTPELVWLPELMGHANGAFALPWLTVVADDPAAEAARFAPWAGVQPQPWGEDGLRLATGGFELRFEAAGPYCRRHGELACDSLGRTSFFGAIGLRTRDLAAALALAQAAGDAVGHAVLADGSLAVRLRDFNCLLVFQAGG